MFKQFKIILFLMLFVFIIITVGLPGLVAAVILLLIIHRANCRYYLKKISDIYGLKFIKGNLIKLPHVEGNYKGLYLNIDFNKKEIFKKHVNIEIVYKKTFDASLYLSNNNYYHSVSYAKVEYGDSIYKKDVSIFNQDDISRIAVFNDKLRSELDDLNTCQISYEISNEKCNFGLKHFRKLTINNIERLIKIAQDIDCPLSIKQRMIENVRTDSNKTAVYVNLCLLEKYYNSDNEVKSLKKEIAMCDNLDLCLAFAEYMQIDGLYFLIDIFENNRYLNKEFIVQALQMLQKEKVDNDYSFLIKTYKKFNNDEILSKVSKIMRAFKLSQYEDFLISNLYIRDSFVRTNLIEALGECGSVKTVEILYNLSSKSFNPLIKIACSSAIKKIQSRLGEVEKGWISVKENDELDGALSEDLRPGMGNLSTE